MGRGFTPWNKVKFEFLLNIDNTIPRGERIKTDFRRLAFEVIRDTLYFFPLSELKYSKHFNNILPTSELRIIG